MANDPFEKLTLEEIRRLREQLLRKMLFEPVADPGFERDTEKLRNLVSESRRFGESLQSSFRFSEDIAGLMQRLQALVDGVSPDVQRLKSIARAIPSLDEIVSNISAAASALPEEFERLRNLRKERSELTIEAVRLCIFGEQLPVLVLGLLAQLRRKQLETLQLWAFLDRLAEAVSKGTPATFSPETLPEGSGESLSDLADVTLEKLEVPNLTPAIRLVLLVLNYIRRGQRHVEGEQKKWSEFEERIFLSAYYVWWSESGGYETARELVDDCERSFYVVQTNAATLAQTVGNFGTALESFQSRLRQYQEIAGQNT